MNVAIVKYNAGNIYSVVNALRRLGIEPLLTDNAEELKKANKVIFQVRETHAKLWNTCISIIWTR